MGRVADDVMVARAYLSRVAEPASALLWDRVRRDGPVATAQAVRSGQVDDHLRALTVARADHVDPYADLDAAERHGIRLVVPESDEWPHFALSTTLVMLGLKLAGQRFGDVMRRT